MSTAATAARRTLQKVRRDSVIVGRFEAAIWKPRTAEEKAVSLDAAERFDKAHKAKHARNGPLGHVGLQVYKALWGVVDFRDGRLEPSIEWLMQETRRCRAAVVAALKRLRDFGFIRWLRRYERTGGAAIRGPAVAQATNAYELRDVPDAALQLVPEAKRRRQQARSRAIPDDDRTRRAEAAAQYAEYQRTAFSETPLGEALARYWSAITKRESARRGESPQIDSYSSRASHGVGPAASRLA